MEKKWKEHRLKARFDRFTHHLTPHYRTSDEGYNSTLRYEKNGSYSTCRLNTCNFPTLTIPCSVSWEGHSECILSLTSLSGSNMVATTAADCMLRIWAAEETKVGIREYKEGSLLGEIDSMDYQEVRFERLEHWNCPVVGGQTVSGEHREIAKRILREIKEEEENINRKGSQLHLLPTAVLMQGATAPLGGGGGGRMGRRRSSSYQESRKKVRSQKAMTAKERFIKSVLTKVMAKKNKKMASQKRASIIMNDDNSNAAFMELFDDGKKAIEEEERKKRSQVQRIVENMRLVLRTANDSKTRGGKVIYGHLYGELKTKERERGGMSFHETGE